MLRTMNLPVDSPLARRAINNCQHCNQRNACYLAAPSDTSSDARDIALRRFTRQAGDRLFRLGEQCTALFQVCSGAIKTQRHTTEGDLIVTGFFLPGDLVGIDALADRVFPCEAIACDESELCQLDIDRLLSSCAHRPGLNAWIISVISGHVRRKDCDLSWSGSLQSHQRVLRFFVDLRDRLDGSIDDAIIGPFRLPMQKQDIARYLHLTPETFSRNLAQLKREGLLLTQKNEFMLPDVRRARMTTGI